LLIVLLLKQRELSLLTLQLLFALLFEQRELRLLPLLLLGRGDLCQLEPQGIGDSRIRVQLVSSLLGIISARDVCDSFDNVSRKRAGGIADEQFGDVRQKPRGE